MRKIGELKGKPIVEGNPNEVKNNQIHAKTEGENITLSERKNGSLETISGSSSGGSSSKYAPRYFSVDWDKCSDSWKYILSDYYYIDDFSYYSTIGFTATTKTYVNENYVISVHVANPKEDIIAFSYFPTYMADCLQEALGVQYQMPFSIDDLIEFINKLINEVLSLNIEPISMEGITEITEEEYYKID